MPVILQINLNRSRPAQNLLLQVAAEDDVGVAFVSELHSVPPQHSHWVASTDGLAVIHWRPHFCPGPYRSVAAGSGFVGVRLGDVTYFLVYYSNRTIVAFKRFLTRLEAAVRGHLPGRIIVGGTSTRGLQLSPTWGSARLNSRGRAFKR